jgi:hypothetical protein
MTGAVDPITSKHRAQRMYAVTSENRPTGTVVA